MNEMTEYETTQSKLQTLNRIADVLEKQCELFEKSIETSQRILAVQILNIKISGKLAVSTNAMSVVEYKELIELVNQI